MKRFQIRDATVRVAFPPGIQETLSKACEAMAEAKFDLGSDVYELEERLKGSTDNPLLSSTFPRILARLDEAARLLHPVVVSPKEAAEFEKRYQLAYLLVAESAVNVLNAHAAIPRPEEIVS